jgi:hypothetical protein
MEELLRKFALQQGTKPYLATSMYDGDGEQEVSNPAGLTLGGLVG